MLAVDEEGESVGGFLEGCSASSQVASDLFWTGLPVIQATPQLWPVLPIRMWLTAWL